LVVLEASVKNLVPIYVGLRVIGKQQAARYSLVLSNIKLTWPGGDRFRLHDAA
jgi:hypothetical protein